MFNRTNDFYFKYLFGSTRNKELALNFINSALKGTGKEFVDIFYTDKDSDPSYHGEKQCRLDIKAKMMPGDIIVDIEMQALTDAYMAERSLFYWSRMYGSQLSVKEEYAELKQTIAINMLDFNFLSESDWKNRYVVANVESQHALTDHLQIVFLELPKLLQALQQVSKGIQSMTPLECWGAYFSRAVDDKEMEKIPIMATALQAEKHFTEEEELRIMYERREDFLRDQRSREYNAKRTQEKLAAALQQLEQTKQDAQQAKQDAQQAKQDAQQAKQDAQQAKQDAQQAKQLNTLYAKLASLGRLDDIQKVSVDANYRKQLLEELFSTAKA